MKAIANALFVVVLAVMISTASALFTAGYTSVLAKKSKDSGSGNWDSGSGSSNSDNGDKGPSDPSREEHKGLD